MRERCADATPGRSVAAALLGLVAGAAVAAGCGAATKNTEPLEMSVTVYNDGLRWQRFQDAASRLPADRRDDFLDERDRLHEDLRIHHYKVIRVRYGPQGKRARVHVKYTWFLNSRGVVHETHVVQRWQRQEAFWVLRGEHLLRGEPMPGVPEAEEDDEAGEAEAGEAEAGGAEAGGAEAGEDEAGGAEAGEDEAGGDEAGGDEAGGDGAGDPDRAWDEADWGDDGREMSAGS